MAQAIMKGSRLAFVVVAQDSGETVQRVVTLWNKKEKKIERKLVDEPAGFLVFFPRGHALRIKDHKSLRHYGLDKEAQIIDMQGLSDPNSPLGKLILADSDMARVSAMDALKSEVINMTKAVAGPIAIAETEAMPDWIDC